MLLQKSIGVRATAACLMMLLATGCGTAANLAGQAASAGASTSTDATGSSSTSGGSLALTEPASSDSSVAKIRVEVLNEASCGKDQGDGGGQGSRDGRRGPPPKDGRGQGGGRDQGGRPPMGGDQGQPGDESGASLDDSTSSATASSTDTSTSSSTASSTDSSTSSDKLPCVVKSLEQDYAAGTKLSLSGIPDGTYTVSVVLSDSSGNPVEQGTASVTITTGETASADITLEAVPEGSVSVNIHEAAAKLTIVSAALSQAANACGAVKIESQDANGTAAELSAALTLNLTASASTGAFYSDSACTTTVTTAVIAAASSDVTVYYKDSADGSSTLTATDPATSGLGAATQAATIAN